MSDDRSNSAGQIKAFVDRILSMKEEAKAINDDIREIYAEAKGNGFDKTALGKLVTLVQKRNENPDAVDEADAILTTYVEAYYGPSRAHARARLENHSSPSVSGALVSATDGLETPSAGTGGDEDRQPFTLPPREPLRPHCLNRDACAGQGSKHCYGCLKAHAEAVIRGETA